MRVNRVEIVNKSQNVMPKGMTNQTRQDLGTNFGMKLEVGKKLFGKLMEEDTLKNKKVLNNIADEIKDLAPVDATATLKRKKISLKTLLGIFTKKIDEFSVDNAINAAKNVSAQWHMFRNSDSKFTVKK